MASRAWSPPGSSASSSRKASSSTPSQERHDLRIRADHVRDVQERQAHLRRDVVGDGQRERVGHVLLAQPRLQLLVQPPRGLHRPHEHLMAPRIEQDPPELLDVLQDEVEQRRSGLRPDVALEGGDGRLVVLDQLGDDGRIGLDRGRRGAGRRPGGALVRERRDEVAAVEDGLQRVPDQRIGLAHRPPGWPARVAGDARRWATSTNSRPPASCIVGSADQLVHGEPERLHGVGHHLLVTDGEVDVVLLVAGHGDREQRRDRPALDDLEVVVGQAPFDVLRTAEMRFDPPAELLEPHDLRIRQRRLLLLRRSIACSRPAAEAWMASRLAATALRRSRRRAPCSGPGSPGRRPAPRRGRSSPRPTATFRLDVTGSAVKRMPAACGKTICCTTTAMWTFRWSKPLRRR